MKKLALILILLASSSFAQYYGYYQPRVEFGASSSMFRISNNDFQDLYTDRWGTSQGAFAAVRVYNNFYALVKYSIFEKEGKNILNSMYEEFGKPFWKEEWLSVGVRIHHPATNKMNSYLGFGMAFFDIEENEVLSLFPPNESEGKEGLFIEFGVEYNLIERAALFFEFEGSSGGSRVSSDLSNYRNISVGGLRFALGLSLKPF